jgi:integrase
MEQKLSNRRRYLTAGQLDQLIKDARKARYGQRDATLMLLMARHGLRVTEAVDLRWDQIDFAKGHLHVRRLKGGIHSVHPIQGDELRNLRELRREQESESAFVFTTERGGPMTRSNVAKLIDAAAKRAGLPHCHPHQLRHTCGHLLADAGQIRGACNFGSATRHQAHRQIFRIERSTVPRFLALGGSRPG